MSPHKPRNDDGVCLRSHDIAPPPLRMARPVQPSVASGGEENSRPFVTGHSFEALKSAIRMIVPIRNAEPSLLQSWE
ncbi:hypothetical protein CCHR01_09632 [Colletotrichum chrysophilum]|uniref:Uncharacterized protein n=1 Tax=Colletotrichum chrysophilum TaxID=1836956 RepID=A0AAD9EHJ8_9PEZI|nr:hypothetical protein CCHR01_09632 [Colletotrichum chrysophilum]